MNGKSFGFAVTVLLVVLLGAGTAAALPSVGSFATPSGAARTNTGPFFWLHGTESAERLREYVGRVDESGQGILTPESRPHNDWMGPGWWRDLRIVIDEAKRRGLKVVLYDDYWYPSQHLGEFKGWKFPIPREFQCRDVVARAYARGSAPASVTNEIVRANARETAKGTYELAAEGGTTLVYSWQFLDDSGRHHFQSVNGLDPAAVEWFLRNIYEPHYTHFKPEFEDGTIVGFFFDEPPSQGWWGPALADELKARGEDVAELLTALKFRLADPERQARARTRFLDARAETWGRTMYGRHSAWCRAHGVYSSGHFQDHMSLYYNLGLSVGNLMQLLKYVESPGVDLVSRQYYPHLRESRKHQVDYGQLPKYASSAAHVYNRHNGLNWSEVFGGYGQDITYPQMKWLCDWHQSQGCHYLIPHSFNPKAPDDTDHPPYFYNGGYEPRFPLFRVWADYNNRCAMLLSEGEHVCRIAQCVPGICSHAGKTIHPEMFAFAIQDAQLDSDWMDFDAVESAVIERNPHTGRPSLRTANGKEHYDILTLPATEFVPWATLEKALAFAKAGGVVVGYGVRPSNTITRGKTAAEAQRLVAEIFAATTALFIDGEPDGAQLRAALAKPYPGEARPFAVRELDVTSGDGRMLALYPYEKDGDRIFFIANQDFANRREVVAKASFETSVAPEVWDPMQGTVEAAPLKDGSVTLALEPSQALFLVWPKTQTAGILPRVERPAGAALNVTVKETVTPEFVSDETKKVERFVGGAKWIWHPVDRFAKGVVTFRRTVELASAGTAEFVFSCDNAATVLVNGETVGLQPSGEDASHSGWRTPTWGRAAFRAGVNVIEASAENVAQGNAGLLAAFRFPDGSVVKTDESWEVMRAGQDFVKAFNVSDYGKGSWGRFRDRHHKAISPFSESVETVLSFDTPALGPSQRVFLVCDDVEAERSAEVRVNGAFAGGFIGAPYRLDVTKSVKAGRANALSIRPFRVKNPRVMVSPGR